MIPDHEHELLWNDRLQDWLDGDASGPEAELVERHLGECSVCQARLAEFEQLDAQLTATLPGASLDAAFDARIFARIEAIDETQRAAARARIEAELQQNLGQLARGWRRALAFLAGGIAGGLALSFTLTAWLEESGLAGALVSYSESELGTTGASFVQTGLTAIFGAVLGIIVARWLTSATD
jgi:anti-sigma factor RsiW